MTTIDSPKAHYSQVDLLSSLMKRFLKSITLTMMNCLLTLGFKFKEKNHLRKANLKLSVNQQLRDSKYKATGRLCL